MMKLVFNHIPELLPEATDGLIPVQLYGNGCEGRDDISVIGNPVVEKLKRLGVPIPQNAIDFLSIALAVTAADTFVKRENASDGWARHIIMDIPLFDYTLWNSNKKLIEDSLHFLSGDIWEMNFTEGGFRSPEPYDHKHNLIDLSRLDCASLFSGGLDSAIGVIDLLENGRKPLLVSHAYKGDKAKQDNIAINLNGRFSHFSVNAYPKFALHETDISMRTRSINFLAFGNIAANAIRVNNSLKNVELFVPENGFISLNTPLTNRRIGSLSTRTTHPHFINMIQELFDLCEMQCSITNPYQFMTKGEMVTNCQNRKLLKDVVNSTVSCSHWHRSNKQCGVCVPCIIRRASLNKGKVNEEKNYKYNSINKVLSEVDKKDDLLSIMVAIRKSEKRNMFSWISDSGLLDADRYKDYLNVFTNGLEELKSYLTNEGIL